MILQTLQTSAWLPAVGVLTLASGVAEKGTRLSRLEARGTGTASQPTFSPDGSALVFAADTISDDFPQLFSVRVNGRAEPEAVSPGAIGSFEFSRDGRWLAFHAGALYVRALGASGAGRRLTEGSSASLLFALTPDSTRVVYRDEGLRSALLDGSAPPVLLTPSLPETVYVTPDSTRALYYADGFHSVPLDASSAPVRLTGPVALSEVDITPDSNWLLYSQSRAPSLGLSTEWFSVPIAGGMPVQLSLPLDPTQRVIGFHALVPGAARFVYMVLDYVLFPGGPSFSSVELRSAPLDGSPGSLLVAAPSSLPGDLLVGAGGTLVYRAVPDGAIRPELFRQQADGSGRPKNMNAPLVPGASVHAFALSPDGARVLYVADQEVLDRREVYSVPIDGSAAPVCLSLPSPTGSVFQLPPLVSPDGRQVVYAVDERALGAMALYSAPIDGSVAARELVSVPGLGLSFTSQVISPDGRRVVYIADLERDQQFELYSVPIDGGATPVRLSAPLPLGATIEDVVLSARGDRVAYLTYEGDGRRNLYLVPSDGSAGAIRLNAPEPGPLAGDVADYGARGAWAVYRADALENGVTELFAAPLDGARPPVRVNRALVAGGDVQEWAFSADGARVVYRADQSVDGRNELFVRTLASRIPARRLHPALGANKRVESFTLDPLGSAVVYRADQDQNDQVELYRSTLDASGVSARLNAPLATGGDVQAFALDPLGVRVVYRADQATDELFELYSRPLDRSADAVRLNLPLVAGGDVLDQAVDALGQRVVYRADQTANEVIELYSVALDASSPALRISAALVAGGDVLDYALDPLGVFVVYRADQERDEVRELYAVPLDGSRAALKLNPALSVAGDVQDQGYALDPLGRRACFAANVLGDGNLALYSAPLDGSAAALRLSPPGAGRFLGAFAFRIDPSGTAAFFLILGGAPESVKLWRAPLDGSGPAVPVTPPGVAVRGLPEFSAAALLYNTGDGVFRVALAGGPAQRLTLFAPVGFVWDFRATPGFVVYRADHGVPGVIDLWSSPLGPPLR
ncbi:MAG: hypothetical protein HOP15_02085 [Planctomycetes bacterium]|nr:hypothetical protein [Planctomycetota bacterium]